MQNFLRTFRRAELRGIWGSNPLEIDGLYRTSVGLSPDAMLPASLTVSDKIESILNYETADSMSSGVLRAIAG